MYPQPAHASLDIPAHTPASQNPQTLQAWLAADPRLTLVQQWHFPHKETLSLWKRQAPTAPSIQSLPSSLPPP